MDRRIADVLAEWRRVERQLQAAPASERPCLEQARERLRHELIRLQAEQRREHEETADSRAS